MANYFINFLRTLKESRYKDLGVIWDCKSLNFVKNYRVTALDLKNIMILIALKAGHHRPNSETPHYDSETPIKLRFTGGPMMAKH